MKQRINLAIAKRQINKLITEQALWLKIWEEAFEVKSPNAEFFINNHFSCGEKISKLMDEYKLKPGFKTTWLDKLICCIW